MRKMTKKEAFDYLKGKKVLLRTEDEQVKLQEFLFNIGYKWRVTKSRDVMKLYDCECMFFIGPDGYISHNEYEDRKFCDTHVYEEIKIKDVLGIEIVRMKWDDMLDEVRNELDEKQILVISKDKVMIIDL